jgi:hypothetical protein
MAEASDLEPFEWLARLGPKLIDRQPLIDYWRRYYEGDQDLPAGPSQYAEAYRRFQRLARTNLCYLCDESRVHRTQVIGFRDVDGKDRADDSTDPPTRCGGCGSKRSLTPASSAFGERRTAGRPPM